MYVSRFFAISKDHNALISNKIPQLACREPLRYDWSEIFIFCRKYGMYAKIKKEMLSRTVEYLLYHTATETASVRHETKVSVIALV